MTQRTFYSPNNFGKTLAHKQTTHLGIVAHPDDLEFMAIHGISECYECPNHWFSGIICTDGRGSIRPKDQKKLTEEEWIALRCEEQIQASKIGDYSYVHLLGFQSQAIATAQSFNLLVDTLKAELIKTRHTYIYTHSPADRHKTHRLVSLAAIQAIRAIHKDLPLTSFWGCEVWGSLEWLSNDDQQILDHSKHLDLAHRLNQCFSSQILGGKNYAEAITGRRIANATLLKPRNKDAFKEVTYAIDLMPLIQKPEQSVELFLQEKIDRFKETILHASKKDLKEML